MAELWVPGKYRRQSPSDQRQPEEIWNVEDEESVAVGRYLTRMRRQESGSIYGSSSSSPEWMQVGEGSQSWDLSGGERITLQQRCLKLYHLNPLAGNIIDTYSFYTMGDRGLSVTWKDETAQNWWEMLEKRNKWIFLTKDITTLTYAAGESYLISFPLSEVPSTKLDIIEVYPTEIAEIETHPDDRRKALSYKRVVDFQEKRYSPKDVIHLKVRALGNALHGRPILERVLIPLVMYDDWLMSMVNLTRMRSRVPLIRYRQGMKRSEFPIKSLPEAGSVIDAHEGVERWEFPSLNLNASDSVTVGEEIKRSISAGVSLPLYMTTGEGSSRDVVGETPLALFQSMQGLFRERFSELIKMMMPEQYAQEPPVVKFPEVDLRGFDERARAVMEEFTSGLRSKRSTQISLGLNPQEEEDMMREELGLTTEEIDELPANITRKIVQSVLFHAPAINAGRMQNRKLERLFETFEKRGWL